MEWLDRIWERIVLMWGAAYVVFCYLFEPSKAWGAVWGALVASFVTKMLELAYDTEKGKLRWTTFKGNFSSTTALVKLTFKAGMYLLLMFLLARAEAVYPEAILHYVRTTILSLAFTIEATNSIKHLSVFPGWRKYGQAFIQVFKKGFTPDLDDLDL